MFGAEPVALVSPIWDCKITAQCVIGVTNWGVKSGTYGTAGFKTMFTILYPHNTSTQYFSDYIAEVP